MRESGINYTKNDQNMFIDFLEKYYLENGITNIDDSRTIVFVPEKKEVIGHDFRETFSDRTLTEKIESALLSFHFGEIACNSIEPENLAVLEVQSDKKLILKNSTMK